MGGIPQASEQHADNQPTSLSGDEIESELRCFDLVRHRVLE